MSRAYLTHCRAMQSHAKGPPISPDMRLDREEVRRENRCEMPRFSAAWPQQERKLFSRVKMGKKMTLAGVFLTSGAWARPFARFELLLFLCCCGECLEHLG